MYVCVGLCTCIINFVNITNACINHDENFIIFIFREVLFDILYVAQIIRKKISYYKTFKIYNCKITNHEKTK